MSRYARTSKMVSSLASAYPWTKAPLIASAPMRLVANAPLAASVSQAGGLGFIGAGNDISNLSQDLSKARELLSHHDLKTDSGVLPLGIGFLLWGAPLQETLSILRKPENVPAAVWFFAPNRFPDLKDWADGVRAATKHKTKIWIQVTSVQEALSAVEHASPEVLVVQGTDAGGHGAASGAGITSLVPETINAVKDLCFSSSLPLPHFVAAGGISDGHGLASCLALGAQGAALGTLYLAASEATIAPGYQAAVLRAKDGGVSTIRSSVYDRLRGTTDWPSGYGGRGVINASYHDHVAGMTFEDNKKLYDEAVKSGDEGWQGDKARLTTYAGTGVGLVNKVESANDMTVRLRKDAIDILQDISNLVSKL